MKNPLVFIGKIIAYLSVLFVWIGIYFPYMLSYPSTLVVVFGFVSTVIFVLFWIYFISKTIKKFFKQNEKL